MRSPDRMRKVMVAMFIATSVLVIMVGTVWGVRIFTKAHSQAPVQQVDTTIGGFPLKGQPAPDFKLTDQFNKPVALSSLRGREVVLAFIDARCTDVCPLTAQILYNAKTQAGLASSKRIVLVAVNTNTNATSVAAVQAWSIQHNMLHQWSFLTGSVKQLQSVYHDYQVYNQMTKDGIDVHDAITFIIDANGHEQMYFQTLNSNNPSDLRNEVGGLKAGMQQWLPQH